MRAGPGTDTSVKGMYLAALPAGLILQLCVVSVSGCLTVDGLARIRTVAASCTSTAQDMLALLINDRLQSTESN